MLQSLNIISGIVVAEPNLFFHIKHISYLSIRIDGHKQSLESLGQELLDLKTFTLFNSNVGNINISTFDNFPSGLTQLIFSKSQSFAGLNNLENLKIMYEKITDIDSDTFRNLKSLKNLTLSHNKIYDIYDKAFHGLNLQLLDLKYNKLTAIKKEMFSGLKCKVLDLSMNEISLIESNSFKNMICQLIFVTSLNIQGGDKNYWGLSNATEIIKL
ncbi:leucine-rich repeat-containing protein egg-6-like [Aphidius gifuensis]|uniref:leucine-rich repeat-containing protein egg-6-like n=1 Tax=Aphidius gifuensis TaxID=684658 RepID=UPI001CDD204C|nr:leucine-rich repeat-containing protein egg-6-like [Aphidius gifuensis]